MTAEAPFRPLSGVFYRVVFADALARVLDGVQHPEGRFHHGGQQAIYMSPTPEMAAIAVKTYLRPGDPDRVTVPLQVAKARVLDFRMPEAEAFLGLPWRETAVPWRDQRAAGLPATSWSASDSARAAGADGMIYPSRQRSDRWHLVLFRWNIPGGPMVTVGGPATEFQPNSSALGTGNGQS